MSDILRILAIDFATVVVAFTLLWAVCVRMRDVTVVDSWWALGMALMALATFVQVGGGTERRVALLAICALWAARLGGYLFWRWRHHGIDRRYVRLMEKAEAQRGWSYAKASFWLVFATQAPMQFVVALPVMLGQIAAEPATLGMLGWAGVALALGGIAFESIADAQLVRFRADPANAGRVLDRGLWRSTRHPNYFGDACTWWGLYLIAAETSIGVWALPGPILLTWTLMKWSGAPTLEHRMRRTRPDYVRYIETTSGFVPWWPKSQGVRAG